MGIRHQSVSDRLDTIRRYTEGLQEFLHCDSPIYEAGSPVVKVAYPMDAAMKNLRKCRMPEYFSECFGDTNTRCTMCENCRRKVDNR